MNNSSHIQSNSNKSCARKRDYRLVVDGKYNRKAIMQRAWAFMKVYKGYTLKSALRQAWIDAILAMEDYNYSQNIKPRLPKSELTMKSLYANPTTKPPAGNRHPVCSWVGDREHTEKSSLTSWNLGVRRFPPAQTGLRE